MPTTLRTPLSAAAAALPCLSLAAAAPAPDARTLDGEHFEPARHIEALYVSGTCNADGPSTFDFSSFGAATGPEAGEYQTYGSFTLASPTGPVTAWDEAFSMSTDVDSVYGFQSLHDSVEACCTPGEDENLEVKVNTDYGVFDRSPTTARAS